MWPFSSAQILKLEELTARPSIHKHVCLNLPQASRWRELGLRMTPRDSFAGLGMPWRDSGRPEGPTPRFQPQPPRLQSADAHEGDFRDFRRRFPNQSATRGRLHTRAAKLRARIYRENMSCRVRSGAGGPFTGRTDDAAALLGTFDCLRIAVTIFDAVGRCSTYANAHLNYLFPFLPHAIPGIAGSANPI